MANTSWTNLKSSGQAFDQMLRRFGVVTVMNAYVYEGIEASVAETKKADEILNAFAPNGVCSESNVTIESGSSSSTCKFLCKLDTLKVANVTVEGPSKTVTGGQYSNPLIKYGKTARLEMQDALGNADAIEAFGGGVIEHFGEQKGSHTDGNHDVLHITEDFVGARTIIGDSFFIDQKTGAQVKVKIIFYQFLPDSIFNLTQDAEGDATVFDMNGDLLTTNITMGTDSTAANDVVHGVFYSVLSYKGPDAPSAGE